MSTEQQKLNHVWRQMRKRCNDPRTRQYKDYGGRGITVCARWDNFSAFLADMGPRPAGKLLDRLNNDGNYEPSNCAWVTRTEQNSNRRNCIFINCNGEQITLREYCRRAGLKYRPIVKRIQDRNWPIDLALKTPIGSGKQFYRIPGDPA